MSVALYILIFPDWSARGRAILADAICLGLRYDGGGCEKLVMSGWIDSHTHLESFAKKGRLGEALSDARNAGIDRLVTIGTDPEDWALYAEMAESFAQIDYTVGIHPCSVEPGWEASVALLEGYWKRPKPPVGLGETGLDRFHLPKDEAEASAAMERQKRAFAAQLELAKRLKAPVVVHSRGAFAECVEMVDESGIEWGNVVFHCFSEGPGEMQQLLDRGGFGSFTGVITFKNAESVREAALLQGIDRLMIETDAPYLAPMPHRGKPNEPAYLAHTGDFCANLFGVPKDELASRTANRTRAFFGL